MSVYALRRIESPSSAPPTFSWVGTTNHQKAWAACQLMVSHDGSICCLIGTWRYAIDMVSRPLTKRINRRPALLRPLRVLSPSLALPCFHSEWECALSVFRPLTIEDAYTGATPTARKSPPSLMASTNTSKSPKSPLAALKSPKSPRVASLPAVGSSSGDIHTHVYMYMHTYTHTQAKLHIYICVHTCLNADWQ